ncbi:putative membrane protein [Cardiobacterium hominis]|uniref:Putative membrane protein n=1 Tax=Cardiobacterium hominis TaxID=2718 RepID=A0A1C3HP21_9GAMM|nr:tellurite resistance TerB family protein [Cardiobacterium hominis]SAY95876.1 putative membrane protein [Cardiobacterium hominis]
MDFNSILNQVLNGGQQIAQQRKSGGTLGNILGNINNDTLKGFGGGVAATGLLSLLMGKKGFGSNALQLGSMAALGALAYNAWKNYQGGQAAPASAAQGQFIPAEERSQAQTAQASELTIKAMIAAAAADGRIDTAESSAILAQIGTENAEARAWLEQQIHNPPTPQSLAAEVGNDPALAAEIYLASRIVCGDLDRREIVYLHELAEALHLDDALVEKLEHQAGF